MEMVYSEKTCPACGGVGRFHTYCSNKCKQKAYRQRLERDKRNLTATVCAVISEDFSEHEAKLIFSLLNTVKSKRECHAVDQALRIITNGYRQKVHRAKNVRKNAQHAIAS